MNQRVICEHLERVGFQVVVAEDGLEGICKVRERAGQDGKPFDLIFMDIHMPVMDGVEAAPKILALGTGTPIVALTANIMTSEREKYTALGMQDYLAKPFTSQELYRCLLKYLKPVGFAGEGEEEKDRDGKLQQQLRNDFVTKNRGKMDEIRTALALGDIVLAHRLAHTLKSTAGLIGRPLLQHAAADVEDALKNGKKRVSDAQLAALDAELSATLNDLAPYGDDAATDMQQAGAATGVYDAQKARDLFAKLEPLLHSGNLESLNLVDDLRAIPGSGELIRQIEDVSFEEATKALAELRAHIGEK
jgi:CheY-like chemotaxis protein